MTTDIRSVSEGNSHNSRVAVPAIPGFTPRAEDRFAHFFRRLSAPWLIFGAGGLSICIYLLFVLAFPLTVWWNHPHTTDDANAINDMGRITGYSPFAAIAFVTAVLALFACQFAVLQGVVRFSQAVERSPLLIWMRRSIYLFPVVFGIIMVWMQPVTTTDLYGYVARGYLFIHLHQNPMITKAVLLPGGLSIDRPPSPYGPAWLVVTALVSLVAENNLLVDMLLFKLIGLVGVVLAIWLVDSLARELYPERRLRIVVLFGWCPLVFFDSIGNGHNDIIMMVCVLAAFALMLRGRARTALASLVIGALLKYVSAVFIPLWLVYELRHMVRTRTASQPATAGITSLALTDGNDSLNKSSFTDADVAPLQDENKEDTDNIATNLSGKGREWFAEWLRKTIHSAREIDPRQAIALIVSGTAISLVLAIVFYAPFWAGIQTFTGLGQQLRPLYYNSSIVGFISAPLQLIVPTSQDAALDKTLRLVFYTLFFVYAYLQTQRLWQLGAQSTMREVITAAAKITFASLLLITFWFQPWYVVWVVPLAALSQEPFVRRQGLILAAGALMTYAVGNFLLVGDTDLVQGFFVQFFEILVAFGPLLLLRAAPYDEGWYSVFRRYAGLIGRGFTQRTVFWERLMVVLILVVAVLLRLVRLGNLLSSGASSTNLLRQASSDLQLYASDPQGLQGPFVAIQGLLIHIFGENAFAVLLPSAVLGSLTVLVIYLMTREIVRQRGAAASRTIAILAALLAATSRWHVSLSRSGMELVVLPLLMCTAMYWLLLALRWSSLSLDVNVHHDSALPDVSYKPVPAHIRLRTGQRMMKQILVWRTTTTTTTQPEQAPSRSHLLYYIGCGVCTGLACDLAPGLWLVPLVVAGVLIIWRLRLPKGLLVSRSGLMWLVGSALVSGTPVLWHYLSNYIGFPTGSNFLARSSVAVVVRPVLSQPFWEQVAGNLGGALNLLISQDYSAGYPAGGASIVPVLLGPFFFLGLLTVCLRWRRFESLVLLLLTALPLMASIAVGTPAGVIEAASVLPAMCIVPALGIYQAASWLGHLPIVLDRINGVRVFSTPEQIGRVLLLGFLLFSTIRTFFWYFEATLPPHQNQYNASWTGPRYTYHQWSSQQDNAHLVWSYRPATTPENEITSS